MSELADLLVQWEEQWRRRGAPVEEFLEPGADPVRVQEVLAGLGFTAPQEVVDWFAWHDGKEGGHHFLAAPSIFRPLSLDQAVLRLEEMRGYARDTAEFMMGQGLPEREDPNFYWEPTWFPIGRFDAVVLTVEIVPRQDWCPVYCIDPWASGEESYRAVRAPSLTAAVRLWVEWLDRFTYTWSPTRRMWEYDPASLPAEVIATGLV